MRKLLRSKKAQLFVIEAFIAVSVMLIMVIAIYEVQLATVPPKDQGYTELTYNILEALDQSGLLEEYVIALKSGNSTNIEIVQDNISLAVYSSLPENSDFYFYCKNITSNEVITSSIINILDTEQVNIFTSEYLVTEVNGTFDPYSFYLAVWVVGV
ncbi:MAG: hypothetical protein K9W46_13330 [Candidatus Heimdallarchaeum endolithica]|uniref:Uncharacterized protein n=1 Tax=Candidatus Heimdallarchaeum endolithica TaxID=2876572 RepID=A0A9Y1BQS7_9ARCH|nr:MAG: hypothetical protein K9W46_13330 [Candidatus Heimdallarchaeum endolithica]